MCEDPGCRAEAFREYHARKHDRSPRTAIDGQGSDLGVGYFREQQDSADRPVASDASSVKIVKTLPCHLNHRKDSDVCLASCYFVRADRRQGKMEIENVVQVGRMLETPDEWNGIQIADSTDSGLWILQLSILSRLK